MASVIVSSNVQSEAIARLMLSVQPLVFETAVVDFPYSTKGTVFLVGFEGKPYVVTTRHGLFPDGPDGPPRICVFPSDTSHRFIPLSNVFFVSSSDEPDDFVDLAIIEVDPAARVDNGLNQATLVNLALAVEPAWESSASKMTFFVIGYPSERSNIDPASQELRTDRVVLLGKYKGKSLLPYLHQIQVENTHDLASFDGLSGSPVFMWSTSVRTQPKPILCGMAIRATASSGLIHFLPVSILMSAFAIKRKQHER